MRFITERIKKNGPELHALFTNGLPTFLTARNPKPLQNEIPVFCYHIVFKDAFQRDLQFLADNAYKTINADELTNWLTGQTDLEAKTVVLTFDDGAVNFYRIAYPALQAYQQKAVLFVSPALHRAAAQETATDNRPCTWEELREMHQSGLVDIQSHTLEHRSLQNWPTPLPLMGADNANIAARRDVPRTMREDLALARQMLEQNLDKRVRHLAWPCYYSDPASIDIALQAGYDGLWTGTLPHIPIMRMGGDIRKIVRISGEFVRRLPGKGRESLYNILKTRYKGALQKIKGQTKT